MEEPLPVTPEPHKTQTQTHSIPDSDTTIHTGSGASKKFILSRLSKRTKWLSLAAFVLVFGSIGSYLLFFSHADTIISNGKIYYGNEYSINADGTGRAITTLFPGTSPTYAVSPIFSPTGDKVAYTSSNNIVVANSDGSNAKTIVANKDMLNASNGGLAWSPDGQWIAFNVGTLSSTVPNLSITFAMVHPDGTGYTTVPNLTLASSDGFGGLGWLKDSNTLVYSKKINICQIKSNGTGNTCKPLITPASGYTMTRLRVSPDNTKILLVGSGITASGNQWSNVYLANIDGTNEKNVTNFGQADGASADEPVWSPDGTLIAYGVSGTAAKTGLYIANADGTGAHKIDGATSGAPVAWQPIVATTQPTDRLLAGQSLKAGAKLVSTTGGYRINMQTDGNLVIYNTSNAAIWNSATWHKGGVRVTLQTDGNLVMYNASNAAVWSAQTSGSGATYAAIQSDGNFVVYKPGGVAVWSSKGGKVATTYPATVRIGVSGLPSGAGVTFTSGVSAGSCGTTLYVSSDSYKDCTSTSNINTKLSFAPSVTVAGKIYTIYQICSSVVTIDGPRGGGPCSPGAVPNTTNTLSISDTSGDNLMQTMFVTYQ